MPVFANNIIMYLIIFVIQFQHVLLKFFAFTFIFPVHLSYIDLHVNYKYKYKYKYRHLFFRILMFGSKQFCNHIFF